MSEEEKKKRYDPRRGGKPPKHLDIIDKLDATSIWGTGSRHLHPSFTKWLSDIGLQCSITMDPLMQSTPAETDKAADAGRWTLSLRARSTTRLAALGR